MFDDVKPLSQWQPSLVACLVFVASLAGAESPPAPAAKPPATVLIQPAVLAYAAAHGVPMEGIEVGPAATDSREGDLITAVVTFRDGNRTKQWLTHFEMASATAKERADHPGKTAEFNLGAHAYRFPSGTPVALEIRTVGPFVVGQKSPADEKQARALISPAFLALGLDSACKAILDAVEKARAAHDASPDDKTKSNASASLDEKSERAVAGLFLALTEFFNGVQVTPGLREILWDVLEKPSLWSIAKRGGKIEPGFNFDDFSLEPNLTIPEGPPCYRLHLVLNLNDQPALKCSFLVTSPRPPLLTSAGIIGITAESPTGKDRHVDIRVVAAHRRAEPQAATIP